MKNETKKAPTIRFRGFTDDWEQRKLGDCFAERRENMPDGELLSVTINDGIKKFSELGRHDNSNDDKSKYKRVCIGDIAYNSMRMWQGASGYSIYEGIVSPAYTVLKSKSNINSRFASYLFKCQEMMYTFQVNSQGITSDNWNLKFPALSQIKVKLPCQIYEQKKVADYLSNLDGFVVLHQRKLDQLKKLKKYFLQNMFPAKGEKVPRIRFKGFTGDWEQRKLGDIAEIKTGPFGSVLHADDYVSDGIPIITTEHFKNGHLPIAKDGLPQVSTEDYKRLLSYVLNIGDIVFSRVGSIDINALVTQSQSQWLFSGRVLRVRIKNSDNAQFLHIALETTRVRKSIISRAVGQTMPSINTEILGATLIFMPKNVCEQEQIGGYFCNLDNLITLHQRKLNQLQTMKKFMLQNLFI